MTEAQEVRTVSCDNHLYLEFFCQVLKHSAKLGLRVGMQEALWFLYDD